MQDKLFVCQRCQTRIRRKTPGCEVGFEWAEKSFKIFKKEAKGIKDDFKLVLTSCLGVCPEKRVAYQEFTNGKMSLERSYPAEDIREKVFKRFVK